MGHNQDIFRAVVEAMHADLEVRVLKLACAGVKRDFVTARAESLALKGTLGEITATSAAYLASILERAADAKDWETFDFAFSEFEIDVQKLKAAINKHLGLVHVAVPDVVAGGYPSGPSLKDRLH